ncbi:MAG: TlpA family protein disulfide reductase [Acidobacteria bacterium]|nr:TlpA family protein disulfide reductase [Acidobacteriota bacterium]
MCRLLLFLLCAGAWAQSDPNPLQILERVANKYKNLDSFVMIGAATRPVSPDGVAQVKVQRAYISRRLVPDDAPLPFIDAAARYKDDPEPAFLIFREIADRVAGAKLLRGETAILGGRSRPCDVLSVHYQDKARNSAGEPVVYWIERETGTVWKLQFSERRASDVWQWTVTLDTSSENEPPPSWAMVPAKMVTKENTHLIGRDAPEITGRTLDGSLFTLSKLRGKVVVLDFWATHCGYCSEEMADLEHLKASFAGQGVEIVGINEEDPERAKRWLAERRRTLPVVFIAPETGFKAYAVDSLPTTLIIDREGKVIRHWIEFASGAKIRRVIETLTAR